ncbi:hypothetical protein Mapa_013511 [Marchantia paleacea]|nr:hypothetical protein Mapa_013511 [Marchantia paleacea]
MLSKRKYSKSKDGSFLCRAGFDPSCFLESRLHETFGIQGVLHLNFLPRSQEYRVRTEDINILIVLSFPDTISIWLLRLMTCAVSVIWVKLSCVLSSLVLLSTKGTII